MTLHPGACFKVGTTWSSLLLLPQRSPQRSSLGKPGRCAIGCWERLGTVWELKGTGVTQHVLWTLDVIFLPTTNLQVLHQCSICMTNFQHPVAQFAPAHPHSARGQCPPILLRILFRFPAVSSPGHPVAESSSFNALDVWVSCAFVPLWWARP